MDELLWQEAARIVSHDSNGPVDAKLRLIQEEFREALRDNDSAVRARLLARLHEAGARIQQQQSEILLFMIERKAALCEEFYLAQKCGKSPPDVVPHPHHVVVRDGHVEFLGPCDRAGRAAWEELKAVIRIAACVHDILREQYRRTGSPTVLQELGDQEQHRRRLMRLVPKGWNWREEIYCRDSMLAFARETVGTLKEMGYVSPADCN